MDFAQYKKQVGVWILKISAKLLVIDSVNLLNVGTLFCIIVHCSAPYFLLIYNE